MLKVKLLKIQKFSVNYIRAITFLDRLSFPPACHILFPNLYEDGEFKGWVAASGVIWHLIMEVLSKWLWLAYYKLGLFAGDH
jgi:hypothetical protein